MADRSVASQDEFALIARIERALARGGSPTATRALRLGIGDDAALVRPPAGRDLAISTDAAVEGVHFRFDWQRPLDVGSRAMNAALSDLAAMGATPLAAVVAMTLPRSFALRRLDAIALGIGRACGVHACPVVGGNLARGRDLAITTTVFGHLPRARALRRDGARPGDRIFVTGTLGGSALALEKARRGSGRRVMPAPSARIAAGRALLRVQGVSACIDLSDGLLGDLAHVLEASSCAAEIQSQRIPLARGLSRWCRRTGIDPLRVAATGGEDYELLFTLRGARPNERSLSKRLGIAVCEIGRVVAGRGIRGLDGLGSVGFRHFRPPARRPRARGPA